MSRAAWKVYYRMLRIYRREAFKAWQDTLVFGTGYLRVKDGFINHILPEHIPESRR